MPRLAEEEEQMLGGPGNAPPTRRQLPPTLPPMPSGLTPEQLKRRHIVASLVHSENNYVASLQRLVNVSLLCSCGASSSCRALFTQSELIELVLPQAAQLGIHFNCFHNTQLEMHLLEGPD